MSKRIFLFLFMIVIVVHQGLSDSAESNQKIPASKEDSDAKKSLEMLRHADPAKDLDQAIKKDDLRFIGIYGYTKIVPGVKDYNEKYSKYGLRMIEGTSDYIANKDIATLNGLAQKYAEQYNLLLLKHLTMKEKNSQPDSPANGQGAGAPSS